MVNKLNCGLPGWFSWIGSFFWGFWKDWFSPYIPPNPSSSDLVAYPSPNEWDITSLFPHTRNNKFQTLNNRFTVQIKLQLYVMDNGLKKKNPYPVFWFGFRPFWASSLFCLLSGWVDILVTFLNLIPDAFCCGRGTESKVGGYVRVNLIALFTLMALWMVLYYCLYSYIYMQTKWWACNEKK